MKAGWGWDLRLDKKVEDEFNKWTDSIPLLKELSIERAWDDEETLEGVATRHVFVDASKGGFGCCIYRRGVGNQGKVRVVFICGRSHVVPKNSARASHHGSIPRLELTAAVKGVEADAAVARSLPEEVSKKEKTIFWSDSSAVLAQIMDVTSPFKTFVRNRLSVIHKSTEFEQWRYVKSALNPADHTSKGIRAHEKEKWAEYLGGPKFLSEDEKDWPVMIARPMEAAGKVVVKAMKVWVWTEEEQVSLWWYDLASKFSPWLMKLAVLATVKRAVDRFKVLHSRRKVDEKEKESREKKTERKVA